ncbi:MAG: FAD binding domain-containing protein, partial [Burkholderiales bacterium]|nr:FAD binding domain-containing protein [Burkholderiales bacterium]
MNPFAYHRARSVDDAVRLGQSPGAHFLGGGTNLIDLTKGGIVQPLLLVDVSRL